MKKKTVPITKSEIDGILTGRWNAPVKTVKRSKTARLLIETVVQAAQSVIHERGGDPDYLRAAELDLRDAVKALRNYIEKLRRADPLRRRAKVLRAKAVPVRWK